MAKAMMVFEDIGEGMVTAEAEFDPPLKKGGRYTYAQKIVLAMCSDDAGQLVKNVLDEEDKDR